MLATDDASLLERVRGGDRLAMEALLQRHAPSVMRFARSMCQDPVDADDVVQETLIAAARRLPALQSEKAIPAWLYTVTRSFCIKRRRRSKHAPAGFDSLEPVAGGTEPDREAEGRELAGALEAAIRGLDPKYREVLVLRDVEGLTAPEVSEILGLQIETVKTRLHRARAAVRARMAPALEPTDKAPPSCPDVVNRFSRFLEGEIGPQECDALHAHVSTCTVCNAACASLRRTVALCHAAGAELPEDVAEKVRAALEIVVNR